MTDPPDANRPRLAAMVIVRGFDRLEVGFKARPLAAGYSPQPVGIGIAPIRWARALLCQKR